MWLPFLRAYWQKIFSGGFLVVIKIYKVLLIKALMWLPFLRVYRQKVFSGGFLVVIKVHKLSTDQSFDVISTLESLLTESV